MIAQILLTAGLAIAALYATIQRARSPLAATVIQIISAVGIYFIWQPEQANAAAHALGIGRGADLVAYCWVVISVLVLLNIHFKIRETQDTITKLVRHLAIEDARNENGTILKDHRD
jgi:hypothetical protein